MYQYEERYKSVQELKARGLGIKPIQRELGMGRNTVRTYYYATSAEELKSKRRTATERLFTECNTCGDPVNPSKRKPLCSACRAKRKAATDQRSALLAEQGDRCGICLKPETKTDQLGRVRKLGVDGRNARALLCGACSSLLGLYRYDPALVDAAAAYLKKHRAAQNPWQRPTETVEPSDGHLAERTRLVIQWRNDGVIFKEIGRRLGVSKQRAVQIWQRTQEDTPLVRICWCGKPVPAHSEGGRPRHFCSQEHARRSGNPTGAPNSWYAEQLECQGGTCAICQQPETVLDRHNGALKALAADHCHETGAYRALLCNNCNIGLGQAHDDPEVFTAAGHHLREHPSTEAA